MLCGTGIKPFFLRAAASFTSVQLFARHVYKYIYIYIVAYYVSESSIK